MGRASDAAHATLAPAAMRHYNRWKVASAADVTAQAYQTHPAPDADDGFMALYAIYRAGAAAPRDRSTPADTEPGIGGRCARHRQNPRAARGTGCRGSRTARDPAQG